MSLLTGGLNYADTRTMAFEFVKQHFDELMAGHPISSARISAPSFRSSARASVTPICATSTRRSSPLRSIRYPGAPRDYAQVLEGIDLCIAQKTVQEPSVRAFLEKY